MSNWGAPQGPFDIKDFRDFIPRKLKPWFVILFVIIIQFSGGVYLSAASEMAGTTQLMQQDILMAGYCQLIGMALNFCVMFRLKFRYSAKLSLLWCIAVMILTNIICAESTNLIVLSGACLIGGWFRMWGTFVCNSILNPWISPKRDMSIFFCYIYLLVDGAIQLSGLTCVYLTDARNWEFIPVVMTGSLCVLMIAVATLMRMHRGMPEMPLLGIDWAGAVLWAGFMVCFTFVCLYGNYYDWWESKEILTATTAGIIFAGINLWRASFIRHPYISFTALKNRNVRVATMVYLVFFTMMASEHVFEHSYAEHILGLDMTNIADLNWAVFAGIVIGAIFTWQTFALRKWRYKTMTVIAFILAIIYIGYFYFTIDYNIEKEALYLPLFCRGAASVIISIVFLTSIQQSGLPFVIFPQGLTINGFTGAVMGATLGPSILGEILNRTVAKNISVLSMELTDTNLKAMELSVGSLMETVGTQALVISMKEIYGWLLITGIISLIIITFKDSIMRPLAYMPSRKKIISIFRHEIKAI